STMEFTTSLLVVGSTYWYDGELIDKDSEKASELRYPTEEISYYETVRLKEGVLLYIEDHLERLTKSVKGIEDFPVDAEEIEDKCYSFLYNAFLHEKEGNLRIVLTKNHLLIHLCDGCIPSPSDFENGVMAASLKWDRVDPNIKVFRGDYKTAVAETFSRTGAYELLLKDSNDRFYEGSKSNLFAVIGNKVYSAPDDKILLGITRKRVISSLERAGGELVTGTFTMEELQSTPGASLFVSSTPFDILPIASVDGIPFPSAKDPLIRRISECYLDSMAKYINERR
ncbi:MAG: aminotransferase class IV, partial [Clostridiales bacterium]|nr:aminotransferase class IV [Clostridiales bacterium]